MFWQVYADVPGSVAQGRLCDQQPHGQKDKGAPPCTHAREPNGGRTEREPRRDLRRVWTRVPVRRRVRQRLASSSSRKHVCTIFLACLCLGGEKGKIDKKELRKSRISPLPGALNKKKTSPGMSPTLWFRCPWSQSVRQILKSSAKRWTLSSRRSVLFLFLFLFFYIM